MRCPSPRSAPSRIARANRWGQRLRQRSVVFTGVGELRQRRSKTTSKDDVSAFFWASLVEIAQSAHVIPHRVKRPVTSKSYKEFGERSLAAVATARYRLPIATDNQLKGCRL